MVISLKGLEKAVAKERAKAQIIEQRRVLERELKRLQEHANSLMTGTLKPKAEDEKYVTGTKGRTFDDGSFEVTFD